MPFQIVRFDQGPVPATVGFATLGLSRFQLQSPRSGRGIRHELLMLVPDEHRDGPIPALLHQVSESVLRGRRALVRGDVIGPSGQLIPGSQMEALYVAMPAYFPDEFAIYEDGNEPVVVAWLVPISSREAAYVEQYGWSAFEDRLVDEDPDLVDFGRSSLEI
jgi:hypothetical protein